MAASSTSSSSSSSSSADGGLLALQLSCRGNAARERLLRDWVAFSEARGELGRLQTLPTTRRGAPLDWLRLYEEVVTRGGAQAVTQRRQWPEVQRALGGGALVDLLPYQVATLYERFLRAFEEKQLRGRDVPTPDDPATAGSRNKRAAEQDADIEAVATAGELAEAASAVGTPLPKRARTSSSPPSFPSSFPGRADFGSVHALVLALDSGDEGHVRRALNLLTILSFGDPRDGGPGMATANENELLVDNVPGLLDALHRQLALCELLGPPPPSAEGARQPLLNTSAAVGRRELLDARALELLNVLRNLSMVGANEKPMADHDELVVLLVLALRASFARHPEIGDHVLDTLCNLSKRVNFLSLHPPGELRVWHPHHQLAAQLWTAERLLPLECLLRQLVRMLLTAVASGAAWGLSRRRLRARSRPALPSRRSVVLRVCELLANVCRDVGVKHLLAASAALRDPELLDTLVALLACARHEFAAGKGAHEQPAGFPIDFEEELRGADGADDGADDDDDDNDDETDETDAEENSRWPAPWENDGLPSGVGMGVVYVSPEGSRRVANEEDARLLDHEIRDAALEVLFRLSDCDDAAKLRMAKHPQCLPRLANVLLSCVGRPEAARIAVATLCNLSMHRATFPFFLPVEKDLLLAACSDASVADILNNVVADVFGMHAL